MKNIKIAIWLDFTNANLIKLRGKEQSIETIVSDIDRSKPKGGSRAKFRFGATDTISEKQYLEKRKNQEKIYFEKVIRSVAEADQVLVFGPAEAKERLVKAIKANPNFRPALSGYETTNSNLTTNQKVAYAKAFFAKK